MEVAVFSFGEASCLVVVQTFTSSTQVQSTGPVIVTRFFFPYVRLLEALWVCSSFHGRQCNSCHLQSSCRNKIFRQLDEDIGTYDWPARSPGSQSHRACMGFSRQTLGSSYLTTSNDSGAWIDAVKDEWASMPQQLIDTLILFGLEDVVKNLPSSQGRSYPLLKTGCFLLDTHHRDVSAFSRIALHATFSIKLLFILLISLLNILEPIFDEEIPVLYGKDIDKVHFHKEKASNHMSKTIVAYLAKKELETGIKCIPPDEMPVMPLLQWSFVLSVY
ncbi:hypothetical protein TNCV_4277061 [Trichonephila clavipes]|nr:hypothetical protein TNCV_4277061 [Trichonephila clavipes]